MIPESPNTLESTLFWFEEAMPSPTDQNFHTQLSVHMEEFGEMLEELQGIDPETQDLIQQAEAAVQKLSLHIRGKTHTVEFKDRVAALDSICDQLVTATGLAWTQHMDPVGGLNEVNRSNWSKYVDGKPVFNEDNKIVKGPNYSRPNLEPFV